MLPRTLYLIICVVYFRVNGGTVLFAYFSIIRMYYANLAARTDCALEQTAVIPMRSGSTVLWIRK